MNISTIHMMMMNTSTSMSIINSERINGNIIHKIISNTNGRHIRMMVGATWWQQNENNNDHTTTTTANTSNCDYFDKISENVCGESSLLLKLRPKHYHHRCWYMVSAQQQRHSSSMGVLHSTCQFNEQYYDYHRHHSLSTSSSRIFRITRSIKIGDTSEKRHLGSNTSSDHDDVNEHIIPDEFKDYSNFNSSNKNNKNSGLKHLQLPPSMARRKLIQDSQKVLQKSATSKNNQSNDSLIRVVFNDNAAHSNMLNRNSQYADSSEVLGSDTPQNSTARHRIMRVYEAERLASDMSLDLIVVNKHATPPVYKLIDASVLLRKQKDKQKEMRRNEIIRRKANKLKEVRMGSQIGDNEKEMKNCRVRVTIEIKNVKRDKAASGQKGMRLLQEVVDRFEGRVNFDMPPKQEQFHCMTIMSALKDTKRKITTAANYDNNHNDNGNCKAQNYKPGHT